MVSFFLFHPLTLEFLSLRCWNSESPHFLMLSLPISSLCVFVYAPVDFLNIFFHTFFWDFWFCFHIFNFQEPLSLILSFTILSVSFPFVVSSPCIVSISFKILLHGYLFYLHVCLFSLLRHLVTCVPRMGLEPLRLSGGHSVWTISVQDPLLVFFPFGDIQIPQDQLSQSLAWKVKS